MAFFASTVTAMIGNKTSQDSRHFSEADNKLCAGSR